MGATFYNGANAGENGDFVLLPRAELEPGVPPPSKAANTDHFLDCRRRTGKGALKLLWETPAMTRQAVPAGALQDAWGRFITNEGKSPWWWLQLTRMGKDMITGKRDPSAPVLDFANQTKENPSETNSPAKSRN